MDAEPAPSANLARACRAFADLLATVETSDLSAPTPCPDWTVQQLVTHVIGGNIHFTALLDQQARAEPDPAATSLHAQFVAGVPALLAAFDAPGALRDEVNLPIGRVPGSVALQARTTDVLVHAWDLARALGAPTTALPEDLAAATLEFVSARRSALPTDRFGPAQPCPATAPSIDQLAAALGRDTRTWPRNG